MNYPTIHGGHYAAFGL